MTQEELDAEMADYWKGKENSNGATGAPSTTATTAAESATAPAPADDDIDMIE